MRTAQTPTTHWDHWVLLQLLHVKTSQDIIDLSKSKEIKSGLLQGNFFVPPLVNNNGLVRENASVSASVQVQWTKSFQTKTESKSPFWINSSQHANPSSPPSRAVGVEEDCL